MILRGFQLREREQRGEEELLGCAGKVSEIGNSKTRSRSRNLDVKAKKKKKKNCGRKSLWMEIKARLKKREGLS